MVSLCHTPPSIPNVGSTLVAIQSTQPLLPWAEAFIREGLYNISPTSEDYTAREPGIS